MNINSLSLTNYRNYKHCEFIFDKSKILIIGKNAQGKTNVLEAIYYLAILKSPRTPNNIELINFDKNDFIINSLVTKNETEIELSFSYTREKKREAKINGIKSNLKDFKSIIKTVLFSTSDLLLLRGTPQDRRDWIDRAISQIYPAYDSRLTKYNKIRTQKNNFLKNYLKTGNYNDHLLDVYNEQISITGSNIIFLRKKFLKEIEKLAQEKHKTISKTENLSMNYTCSFLGESSEVEEIEKIQYSFLEELENRKSEELRRGQACVGPHRDDIIFYINNNEATKFASQGQQRTIVLSLKLSELDIISQKTGETPILLLDDVLAELDDIRQNYLLKSIKDKTQTIITSVDTLLFEEEFLKDVKIYKIDNGEIINS